MAGRGTDRLGSVSLPARSDDALRHLGGVLAFLAVYAYFLRDIAVGRLYAFGDFAPFFGYRALGKFAAVWHDGGLGYSYIFHALPAYVGGITVVGGVFAQNLLFLSLLPIGFLGSVVFSRRFVTSLPARYLAAGLYAVNPVTIGEFVNGGITALIGFAGLPFVLHYLWRVVERDRWRDSLLAGVEYGATAIIPWLAFWMVAPFALYLLLCARRSASRVSKLAVSGALGVALTLPSLHYIAQRAGQFDTGRKVLVGTMRWNYADADPLPVLRLAGNKGTWAMNALGYNADGTFLVGLVIPAVALVPFRRERLRVFYAVAAGAAALMVATKHGLTYPLFDAVPLFWSLRNPVKLQYPMLLSMSVLFAAGAEILLRRAADAVGRTRSPLDVSFTTSRRQYAAMAAVALVLGTSLFAYALPASGAMGLEAVRGDEYYVSDEQQRVADRLDGRAIWVPYGYTTQLQLRHAAPNHVGIRSGGILQGIQNAGYVSDLFSRFARDPASVRGQLSSLGVQYVVVSHDPPNRVDDGPPRYSQQWGAPWLVGDPAAWEERFAESAAFERAFVTENYAVFRVRGVSARSKTDVTRGLHTVYYPTESSSVDPVGDNLLSNGEFADGLDGWWAGGSNTEYAAVASSDGEDDGAVRLRAAAEPSHPVAQRVPVRDGVSYRISVESSDPVGVLLVWYDGEKSTENVTARRRYGSADLPTVVRARGTNLSVRVRPADGSATVDAVSVRRSTFPAETGYVANTESIPGVTVDGRARQTDLGTTVAVNLGADAAERVGADVRVVDAETALNDTGTLVLNDTYRQGAGVALPDGETPEAVPDGARTVTREGPNGTVLDYWVVGEFGDRPVTVYRTSYDERWRAASNATHFRADGWANGYVGADVGEVRWDGATFLGQSVRWWVVRAWLGLWVLALAAVITAVARSRRR